jgi:hypothetical protein
MISSHDGTDERRAFAFFFPAGRGRDDASSAAEGSAGAGTAAVAAAGADVPAGS